MNQIGNFYIKQVLTVVLKQDVAKAGKGWGGVGGIPNSLQSPDIGQDSSRSISDFRFSGQSIIKEN